MASLRRLLVPTPEERREHPWTAGVWIRVGFALWLSWTALHGGWQAAESGSPLWWPVVAFGVAAAWWEWVRVTRALRRNVRTEREVLIEQERERAARDRRAQIRENRRLLRQMERDRREREDEA